MLHTTTYVLMRRCAITSFTTKIETADTHTIRHTDRDRENKKATSRGPEAKRISFIFTYESMAAEVEETLKRIQQHKGVFGTIVVNSEGIPIKTTMDNTSTVQYASLVSSLAEKARSVVRDLDPTNDLTFLRVRTKKHEIMLAPDKEYILIVIQNPAE